MIRRPPRSTQSRSSAASDVYKRQVDLLCLRLAADRLPEAGPVVEVVRDDGAVLTGRLHGLDRDLRRRLGQCREDATGVEPARAELAEEVVEVDVAGLQLADRGVSAVGHADC